MVDVQRFNPNVSDILTSCFTAYSAASNHLEYRHVVRLVKKTNVALLLPPLSFIIAPVCITQPFYYKVKSYL